MPAPHHLDVQDFLVDETIGPESWNRFVHIVGESRVGIADGSKWPVGVLKSVEGAVVTQGVCYVVAGEELTASTGFVKPNATGAAIPVASCVERRAAVIIGCAAGELALVLLC
jgi:hypothetical protein